VFDVLLLSPPCNPFIPKKKGENTRLKDKFGKRRGCISPICHSYSKSRTTTSQTPAMPTGPSRRNKKQHKIMS